MLEEKKRVLTSKDRDRIIRRIIRNPWITREEIEKETGIHRQNHEKEILLPLIQDNTRLVFGDNIRWESLTLHSIRDAPITPDLVGRASQGRSVIVEVKLKFNFHGKNNPRTDREHKSIGQILQYTCAYRRLSWFKDPRLFIVSIDFSPDVSAVCEYLKEFNIDIQHIAIEKILSEKEVSA